LTNRRTISLPTPPETMAHEPPRFTRRKALARALALPLVASAGPVFVVACSRALHCDDTSALSADDARLRREIAVYVEQAPDAAKHCAVCVQFTGSTEACGTCKVVKGPINPNGSCKLFVAKTS
jgi:hypothetical protein